MNKIILIFGIIFAGAAIWFFVSKSSSPGQESDIISKNGLHWHSNINIRILGEAQGIPAGLGLERLPHNPMHTHDRDNVIHLEFSGTVKKDDLRIANFFEIWGKTFNKDCIFDKCSGADGQMKMLVNGKENGDFENYAMQDNDKIEIIFEAAAPTEFREIIVTGTEFAFSPASIIVKAGEKVKLIFQNNGEAPHNLTIEGMGISTQTIGGGKTDAVEFIAPLSGNFNIFCSVPGHKESGMAGQLKIE